MTGPIQSVRPTSPQRVTGWPVTRQRVCRRWVLAILILDLATVPCSAQPTDALPPDLAGVTLTQQLDAVLPLELQFTDQNERTVRLGDYFGRERPVLLTFAYHRCPMLCSLVLDAMVRTLSEIDLAPGQAFDLLTVSIDPRESLQRTRLTRQKYLSTYGRVGADRAWQFLRGDEESIRLLAEAAGFGFRYLEESGEFVHPATLIVVTPDGRISRYLPGLEHDPKTVRLSLIEASEGRIGSVVDQFLLYCYRYDAEDGRYAPVAMRIMRVGGGVTVLLLGGFLLTLWRRNQGPGR